MRNEQPPCTSTIICSSHVQHRFVLTVTWCTTSVRVRGLNAVVLSDEPWQLDFFLGLVQSKPNMWKRQGIFSICSWNLVVCYDSPQLFEEWWKPVFVLLCCCVLTLPICLKCTLASFCESLGNRRFPLSVPFQCERKRLTEALLERPSSVLPDWLTNEEPDTFCGSLTTTPPPP